MRQYLEDGIFEAHQGFVLVERTVGDEIQTGLIVALDLEAYNYNVGSKSLIRATEGTILDRLPPPVCRFAAARLSNSHTSWFSMMILTERS